MMVLYLESNQYNYRALKEKKRFSKYKYKTIITKRLCAHFRFFFKFTSAFLRRYYSPVISATSKSVSESHFQAV